MKNWIEKWTAPKDAAPLVAFRILFGALMSLEAFASYLHKVPERYAPNMFHFTYPGFHWVTPPPGYGIYLVIIVMGLAAFCVTLGFRYRIAALVFLIAYTYIFLIERAAYNNHYYLIILLAFLFVLVDAHADAAMDTSRRPEERRGWVPAWQVHIFRIQIALVYFFGGVAKISPDWLRREPITGWIQARAEVLTVGPLLKFELVPYLLAYGGLAFDLSIGFLLLWRKSRPFAILLVLMFHFTNAYIFSIGVFPWLGIGATVLFLDETTVRRILNKLGYARSKIQLPLSSMMPKSRTWLVAAFTVTYLAVQFTLPLRHWAIPGEVNWTEEGHDFSWHMKLRGKDGAIQFRVLDQSTGEEFLIDESGLRERLTDKQLRRIIGRPVMMAQYARQLRREFESKGHHEVAVYADSTLSLNGRPPQPLVRPDVDLSRVENSQFRRADWITTLDPTGTPGVFTERPEIDDD